MNNELPLMGMKLAPRATTKLDFDVDGTRISQRVAFTIFFHVINLDTSNQ